jgi:hypothetical protein
MYRSNETRWPSGRIRMHLAAVTHDTDTDLVAAESESVAGHWVAYDHGHVTEWHLNDPPPSPHLPTNLLRCSRSLKGKHSFCVARKPQKIHLRRNPTTETAALESRGSVRW